MVARRKPVQDALFRKKQSVQQTNDQVQRLEQVKSILEAKGIHDFALMMADEAGNARVHTFGHGKKLLDGATFAMRKDQRDDLSLQPPLRPSCEIGRLSELPHLNENSRFLPSMSRRARRAGRAPHRARTMLPEADLSHVVSSAPTSEYPIDLVSGQMHACSEAEDRSCTAVTQSHRIKSRWLSIRLNDVEATTGFYESRLKLMQQLPAKKIAKAWIKGICPKKQARYPYSAGKGKKQHHVPPFWPSTDDCPFVEPDHIDRHERTKLLIHFLRLRATPEQLKEWHEDTTDEYNETHVSSGWTAFLQELAGPEIFDELPRGPPGRSERRRKYLDQIYELASMEEGVQQGRIDPTEQFFYEPDEETIRVPTPVSTPAPGLKRSREQAEDSSAAPTPRSSSSSVSECNSRKKFPKKSPVSAVDEPPLIEKVNPKAQDKKKRNRKSAPTAIVESPAVSPARVDSPRQLRVPSPPPPSQNSSPEFESIPTKKESRPRPRRHSSSQVPFVRAFNGNMWNGKPLPSYLSPNAGYVTDAASMDFTTNLTRLPIRQDFAPQQYCFDQNMAQFQQAEQMSPISNDAMRATIHTKHVVYSGSDRSASVQHTRAGICNVSCTCAQLRSNLDVPTNDGHASRLASSILAHDA